MDAYASSVSAMNTKPIETGVVVLQPAWRRASKQHVVHVTHTRSPAACLVPPERRAVARSASGMCQAV